MKKYLHLNRGVVVGYFNVNDDIPDTENAIQVAPDFDAGSVHGHAVLGGAFVPPPSIYHSWDGAEWWVDLDTLKNAKWASIKHARSAALVSPLQTPYGVFDATVSAQKSITDAVLLLQTLSSMGTPAAIDFTLADNTTVTLSTAQMVEVGLLLGQRTQEVYAKGRTLRVAIDASTTADEVEAVQWSQSY